MWLYIILLSFTCMSCGRVCSSVVYICVPTASKAPRSSKMALLHPIILVRFDTGKVSKVLKIIKYMFSEVAEVVSRTNKALEHKGSP